MSAFSPTLYRNLGDAIDRSDPDATALIDLGGEDGPRHYTYRAFDALCDAVARGLMALGLTAGERVVIVDDVLTTGESVVQAIEAVEAIGAKVLRVVCIVDRLQGARERLAAYDFRPLFTFRDLGIVPAATAT